VASDKSHHSVLDGHRDSVVANHPDGQFALNTAATSDHSLHANFSRLAPYLPADTHYEEGEGPYQAHLGVDKGITCIVSTGELREMRAERLVDQPELIVKDALPGSTRVLSALSREFSGHELAIGAVGLYAAYSVLARA
jgi:hypothetical protein